MAANDTLEMGPASGARIDKDGEKWTLILVRDLRHPPAKVWKAITEPEHLRAWAPFDADRSLGSVGTVTLTTVGMPNQNAAETRITRADPPKVLEYNWGGNDMRWELEPTPNGGTRLTLWHNIDRNFIAMGAAGWHVCLAVMDRFLDDRPVGRIVGMDAMKFGDWQRLHKEYAEQFKS